MAKEQDKKETTEKKIEVNKKKSERQSEIQEKESKLLDLRIDLKMGKLKNPNEIRKLRKEIAQLKTKISLEKFISGDKGEKDA